MSYSKLDQRNKYTSNDVCQFMEVRSVNSENQTQRKQHDQDTDYENGPYYFHGSKPKHQFPGYRILLLQGISNPTSRRLTIQKLRKDDQNGNNGN